MLSKDWKPADNASKSSELRDSPLAALEIAPAACVKPIAVKTGPTNLPIRVTCFAILARFADSPAQGIAEAASNPTFNNVCPATDHPFFPRFKSAEAIKPLLARPVPRLAILPAPGNNAATAPITSSPAA